MLTINDMTAPTEEGRALQLKQYNARETMYDVWNTLREKFEFDEVSKQPEFIAVRDAYNATVTELETLLGTDAHCGDVDMDLWSLFSDIYKDDNGFRPRFHQTRAQVKHYLDNRPEPTLDD